MMNREQAETRIAELRDAATMAHLDHCYEAPRAVIPNHSLHAVDFCPEINAALTALQRAERAYGAWLQPVGHFAHDDRCSWCNESYRRKQQAEAELKEALR
mgnify:CR=1 FL=1